MLDERNARFTTRSSPESMWKEMTPRRPPSSSAAAWAAPAASAPGSSLTAMRTAWKVRVASWVRLDHAARGTARFTTETDQRRPQGAAAALLHEHAGDAPGVPLLAVLGEQARDLLGGQAAEQVGGGGALVGIEAHVERLLAWKEKPRPESSS